MKHVIGIDPSLNDQQTKIEFTVFGKGATAGSKRAFPFRRKDGKLGVNVTHDNASTKGWMNLVAQVARQNYDGPLLTGAIRLELSFFHVRPKSHYGTGRNADKLKDSAPKHKITMPDTIKLARAVEDALKGVLWRDDNQVCEHHLRKLFGDVERVHVLVTSMDKTT